MPKIIHKISSMKNLLCIIGTTILLLNIGFCQNNCDPISKFPWIEGFEKNGTEFPPCWIQEITVPSWVWKIVPDSAGTPSTAYEGNFKAQISLSMYTLPIYVTRLISPVFDLSTLDSPILSYWHTQIEKGNLKVYYKNSANASWVLLQTFSNSIPDWQKEIIALPNKSDYYQIAFQSVFGGGKHDVQLDNIRIMELPDSTDATLLDLSVSVGELNPAFNSNILNYAVDAGHAEEITITATPTNPNANVSGAGTFLLESGQNIFPIKVTAEDGVTEIEYTIMITRLFDIREILSETKLISIYPNPTTGVLNLIQERIRNYELGIKTLSEVEVFDVYGRKQKAEIRKGEEEKEEVVVDVSDLQSGIYFVKIITEKGVVTKKIIKY